MGNQKISDQLQRLAHQKSQIKFKEKMLKNKDRKFHIRRLMEFGSVLKKLGMHGWDEVVILGACLEMQEKGHDPAMIEYWRKKGEALKAFNQTTLQPLIVIPPQEGSDALTQLMQEKKFKWNRFRKEWYGYGVKEEIEGVVKDYHVKVHLA